jgi:hypothetical protein
MMSIAIDQTVSNLKITQLGGGWGSKAGDCCLIQWKSESGDQSHILIDLGNETMYTNIKTLIDPGSKLKGIILTHLHSDHIGGSSKGKEEESNDKGNLFMTLGELSSESGFLVLPKLTNFEILKGQIKEKATAKVTISEEKDHDFETTYLSYRSTNICFKIELIYPDLSTAVDKAENKHSLGCLITVYNKETEQIWRMLTLGDMENLNQKTQKTAETAILTVVGENEVHVIKLPHHASKSNKMEIIQELIHRGYTKNPKSSEKYTRAPRVISSGFSQGADSEGIIKLLCKQDISLRQYGAFYFLGNQGEWEDYNTIKKNINDYLCNNLKKSLWPYNWDFDAIDNISWEWNGSEFVCSRGASFLPKDFFLPPNNKRQSTSDLDNLTTAKRVTRSMTS